MRKEFIEAVTRYQAQKMAPWAASICKCDGGYIAFESADDARVWRGQK